MTIDVQDTTDVKTNLENSDGTGKLSFSGKVGDLAYDLNLPLLKEIDVSASQVSVSPRNIFVVIHKVKLHGSLASRHLNHSPSSLDH